MGLVEGGVAIAVVAAALVAAGPRAVMRAAQAWIDVAPGGIRGITAGLVTLSALAFAVRLHVRPLAFLASVGATSAALVGGLALARRFDRVTGRVWQATLALRWMPLAIAATVAAVAIGEWVLDRFPHVSDEIAYLFQARTLAAGEWWLPVPAEVAAFELPHVMTAEGRWFGIFPPGWPALLAAGVRTGVPWLVNPLLALAAVFLFSALARRVGLTDIERQIATVALVLAPCFTLQAATWMSHLASLDLLLALLLCVARLVDSGALRFAAAGALALAGGLLVRSFDFVAAGAPIGAWLLWRWWRARHGTPPHPTAPSALFAAGHARPLAALALLALGGALAVGATLLHQRELLGDPLATPAVRYFEQAGAGRFGVGFGADMGTRDHGPEWPGYWPSDIPRVSGYRLVEWFRDTGNAPLALLLLVAAVAARWRRETRPLVRVTWCCGAAVIAAYSLHFYHGIAYGARHWFLALPAFAMAVGITVAALPAELRRAIWLALLLHALLLGLAPRLHEYSVRYRGVSGELRESIAARRAAGELDRALVFVVEGDWGWKFAAPLNEWPLADPPVLLARDRGEANAALIAAHPDRERWRVRMLPRGQAPEWTRLP
ncbi:MAG: hypothetical protein FJ293_08370 [Planctomycetes bacterium]|nr:hypothetical protein [Planctomycetota bacterium]